jgi:hypothetical protein
MVTPTATAKATSSPLPPLQINTTTHPYASKAHPYWAFFVSKTHHQPKQGDYTMALNQTQRDHALKMVEKAIIEKKNVISIKPLDKKEWIEANYNTDVSYTIKEILADTKEKYYSCTFEILELMNAKDEYDAYYEQVRQNNTLLTAGLTALEFELNGVIMFGNDFSVVSEALERIANFS